MYGLLCAGLAAEAISGALWEDDLKQDRLSEYDACWREQLGRELRTGLLLRQFYNELSDRQIDILFSLTNIEMITSLIRQKVRFDWHGPLIESVLGQGLTRNLIHTVLGLPLFPFLNNIR